MKSNLSCHLILFEFYIQTLENLFDMFLFRIVKENCECYTIETIFIYIIY